MNYDVHKLARIALGRALIATSHTMARHGARLIGHPSAQAERVVERPALRVVPEGPRPPLAMVTALANAQRAGTSR